MEFFLSQYSEVLEEIVVVIKPAVYYAAGFSNP
jgi:hypothetical protein